MQSVYGLVVKNSSLKTVKNALEINNVLLKTHKIKPFVGENGLGQVPQRSVVPTAVKNDSEREGSSELDGTVMCMTSGVHETLRDHGIPFDILRMVDEIVVIDINHEATSRRSRSPFDIAVEKALTCLEPSLLPCPQEELLSAMPKSYSVYPPMLLLSFHVFKHALWQTLFRVLGDDPESERKFYTAIAQDMNLTHIAINAIIPADNAANHGEGSAENILRSPSNLEPVFGDYGPSLPAFPQYKPLPHDFDSAFWVSTKQNGIMQIWAPRYTMFSAGNVTEKARLLTLSSLRSAVADGQQDGRGSTAVDLFAGIGYFAFSYVMAGCTKVLCWDLNPWSIEGLRRGANANKWTVQVFDFEDDNTHSAEDAEVNLIQQDAIVGAARHPSSKMLAFRETNELAMSRISFIRHLLPPIRHVNCGTLPTIGEAWKTAVKALDPLLGGWIHLHETVSEKEMQQRADHYVQLLTDHARQLYSTSLIEARLEHTEVIKSIGPRLFHVVFDIRLLPPPIDRAS